MEPHLKRPNEFVIVSCFEFYQVFDHCHCPWSHWHCHRHWRDDIHHNIGLQHFDHFHRKVLYSSPHPQISNPSNSTMLTLVPLAFGSQVEILSRWSLSTVSRWTLTRRQVAQYLLRLSVAASCRRQPPHTFSSAVFASVFQKIVHFLHFHFLMVDHVTIYLVKKYLFVSRKMI